MRVTSARIGQSLAVAGILGVWAAWSGMAGPTAAQARRPASWDDATHGSRVKPDYGRVFGMDTVHELKISIAPESARAMREDLKTLTPDVGLGLRGGGPRGGGPRGGGPRGGAFPPAGFPQAGFLQTGVAACSEKAAAAACSVDGQDGQCTALPGDQLMCLPAAVPGFAAPGGGMRGRGGALNLTTRDPMYVAVTVQHDGRAWTKVGMRYKGNSSLVFANMNNSGKVPFRLDFDRYEDEFPETQNQRFYGFQKLTFSSNFGDDSQIREVLATEIFRDRGVPSPRAAFYRVMVDTGSGFEYWGLYSMIEDPADGAMLDAQLGGQGGNLYKPEGPGADWTEFSAEGFKKKTNEAKADFSDVQAAIAALHAAQTDRRTWRAGLEATFDVDLFLRWLAVNTVIQNWDAYGAMAHNYYLYGDPAQKGRLRWIPWDNNFALGAGFGFPGGFGGRAGGPPPAAGGGAFPPFPMPGGRFGGSGTDILHAQVGSQWPLIQRVLADDVYAARYREHLEHAIDGIFAPAAAKQRVRALHALIAPSVVGERGERPTHTTISSPEAFERAVDGPGGLIEIIERRHAAVRAALDGAAR